MNAEAQQTTDRKVQSTVPHTERDTYMDNSDTHIRLVKRFNWTGRMFILFHHQATPSPSVWSPSGVFLLLKTNTLVHVGQAEDAFHAVAHHPIDVDWEEAIIFVSDEPIMSPAARTYLQGRITGQPTSRSRPLGRITEAVMDEYFERMQSMLQEEGYVFLDDV